MKSINNELQASPVFLLLIDETTDVSVTKQMIIYCLYFIMQTRFLGIVEHFNDKAVTITDILLHLCEIRTLCSRTASHSWKRWC